MTYTHILWDFNGTILDDVETGILSVNVMLEKRGLPVLESVDDYRNHFRFPITSYYESLGFDFEKEPFNILAPEWVELYLKYVKSAPLRDGIIEALDLFSENGAKQYIISATEKNMLNSQLTELGIKDYFDGFVGLDNIHASSKVEIAKQWYTKENPKKAVLIGDTEHDAEVADALGCECILVANGHQHKETLIKCKAVVLNSVTEAALYINSR